MMLLACKFPILDYGLRFFLDDFGNRGFVARNIL